MGTTREVWVYRYNIYYYMPPHLNPASPLAGITQLDKGVARTGGEKVGVHVKNACLTPGLYLNKKQWKTRLQNT